MKSSLYICLAFAFGLAAARFTQENGCCPHKTTTTTTHRTTTHKTTTPQTTHPHTNHTTLPTTVPNTTEHTTIHSTLHTTTNHTTANHTSSPHTTATTNHTTANYTSAPHTTATANHTTANHTSAPLTTANSTSAPHTTNHTEAPSTTMLPTVNPDIAVGEYTVTNGSEICLRAKLGLKLMIRHINGSQPVWGSVLVPGPPGTVPSGNCSDQKAVLKLTFPEGFITFTFHKNVSKQFVYLGEILLRINHTFPHSQGAAPLGFLPPGLVGPLFHSAVRVVFTARQREVQGLPLLIATKRSAWSPTETSFEAHNSSLHEFETLIGKSYRCKNLTIDVTSGVALNIVQEQVQAFQLQDGQFGRADHCSMDQPSMVVPIIVGVILAVLIIIVIVAYLIGRRRSYNGYQSI